jgi:hypothetical protein
VCSDCGAVFAKVGSKCSGCEAVFARVGACGIEILLAAEQCCKGRSLRDRDALTAKRFFKGSMTWISRIKEREC